MPLGVQLPATFQLAEMDPFQVYAVCAVTDCTSRNNPIKGRSRFMGQLFSVDIDDFLLSRINIHSYLISTLKSTCYTLLHPGIYSQNGPFVPKTDHFPAISIPIKRRKNKLYLPAQSPFIRLERSQLVYEKNHPLLCLFG
jgi:hypothetical protein